MNRGEGPMWDFEDGFIYNNSWGFEMELCLWSQEMEMVGCTWPELFVVEIYQLHGTGEGSGVVGLHFIWDWRDSRHHSGCLMAEVVIILEYLDGSDVEVATGCGNVNEFWRFAINLNWLQRVFMWRVKSSNVDGGRLNGWWLSVNGTDAMVLRGSRCMGWTDRDKLVMSCGQILGVTILNCGKWTGPRKLSARSLFGL